MTKRKQPPAEDPAASQEDTPTPANKKSKKSAGGKSATPTSERSGPEVKKAGASTTTPKAKSDGGSGAAPPAASGAATGPEESAVDVLALTPEEIEQRKRDFEEERERMQAILEQLSPEQMDRYECYRRSLLARPSVKRLMQSMIGSSPSNPISPQMVIVMCGLAKLYVGDLVEGGRTIMAERNETGPLRPIHLREAYRRLSQSGSVPCVKHKPYMFRS
mmetsp:Transcript_20290/g.24250  ORF Transcript_20290/g.24250 Transcript_20290/m.24250 type:complete len:219 (-) Transcript_20290:415-1071(-)|eukprot:CAMPEP_0197857062 /NCGR_PEP_ID=MMETSP1438-20131217/29785_1 /TAXON_ID=1461541 /ORGANISM="Pterosperma sp., Strain CCMP1384" /LENGTH=218 /DNA_ID=CAMNT_0043472755 /DNA_START=505 /DNA_END=1161 /DNA_ORIENTATION=+